MSKNTLTVRMSHIQRNGNNNHVIYAIKIPFQIDDKKYHYQYSMVLDSDPAVRCTKFISHVVVMVARPNQIRCPSSTADVTR